MTLFSAPMIVAAEGIPDEMVGNQLPDIIKYQSRTMVDGKYVKFPNTTIIDYKTAYLPLKDIMEKTGYQVKWNAATKNGDR